MDYKVVYDIQTSGIRPLNFLFMFPGIIVFVTGIVAFMFRRRLTNPFGPRPLPQRFPFYMLLIGTVWIQISVLSLVGQYAQMNAALDTGHVNVIEGKVEHFTPTHYIGLKKERFCISDSDACFGYSDYDVTPGFNVSSAYGGPLHDGLPVRITYKDNTILKLEVSSDKAAYTQQEVPAEVHLSPAR